MRFAEDGAGYRGHPPAALWGAELPVRGGEQLHEQVVLTYSSQSRAHSVILPGELVEPVAAATARYRRARQRLEAEANAGLEALMSQLGRQS